MWRKNFHIKEISCALVEKIIFSLMMAFRLSIQCFFQAWLFLELQTVLYWSWFPLGGESAWWPCRPNPGFSDFKLGAWNWPRWQCLHQGNWKILQIGTPTCTPVLHKLVVTHLLINHGWHLSIFYSMPLIFPYSNIIFLIYFLITVDM